MIYVIGSRLYSQAHNLRSPKEGLIVILRPRVDLTSITLFKKVHIYVFDIEDNVYNKMICNMYNYYTDNILGKHTV